jgi:LacI family transcriptional regulator
MVHIRQHSSKRAATLADVGRAAGVSAMAVSAVLNAARTSSRISAGTRERIFAAAARLRYRPNAAARALANRRMNTIGVAAVFGDGEIDAYFLEVFAGVVAAATAHGQNTTVFSLANWAEDAARLGGFCDGRIDGMILVGPRMPTAAGRALPPHTPFVALHANHPLPGVINLESDEESGACQMVRHLIELGHRRILHLGGERGALGALRRLRGYRRALTAGRIRFDPDLVCESAFSAPGGYGAFRRWLREHVGQPLPQAVFCANDAIAMGCLEAMAEVGLKAPEDMSVAGFDDTVAARTTVPQLAAVRQPLRAMGSRAVELLLDRMGDSADARPAPARPTVFAVDLVIRASVGPPPAQTRIAPS